MGSTGDSLGDYRARAAACRAMAEKAAEFPSETRTWIQIAEMWEGLAERAEAQPAVGTDEVPVPEDADGNATELGAAPASERSVAVPSDDEDGRAAPARSPMRRVAVVAGFLLLPVLAVAAFWPGNGEPTATLLAERSTPAPAWSEPTTPSSKVADAGPAPAVTQVPAAAPASTPVAQPAVSPQAAAPASVPTTPPGPATPPPAPERVAEAPPAAPAPETLSETGSVGVRPEPPPEPAAPAPKVVAPSSQKVAALPPADRLHTRPAEAPAEPASAPQKLTGTWWPTACPKLKDRRSAVPMVLAENRARAGAASCTFLKKTQAGAAWTVVAKCSDGHASWTANIRLVLEGKRLQWASERGTQTYQRCG
jgi:hypothetical protein